MPINIVCPECNKQYRAPDAMAGRRVRCKGCHNVFKVGDGAESNGTSSGSVMDLHAHAQSEYGQTAYAGGRDDEGGIGLRESAVAAAPSDPSAVFESAFQSFVPDRRENVPFKFPWSRQLDKATPWLLVLVATWVALPRAMAVPASDPGWVIAVRVLVLLAVFLLIVYPLTRMAVTRASNVLRFELPPRSKWRTIASFALPFALVYALWSISTELHFGFIAGSVMAVLLAAAAVYFLFRLEPQEAPGTLSTTAGAFVVSLVISAGVMLGMNWLAMELSRSGGGKNGDQVALADSPIAAGLPWELPAPAPTKTNGTPGGGDFIPAHPEPEPLPPIVETPAPQPPTPAAPGDRRTRPAQVARGAPPHDPGPSALFPVPRPGDNDAATRPANPGAVAVVRTPPGGTSPETSTIPKPPTGTEAVPPAPAPAPVAAGDDPVAAKIREARSPLVENLPDTSGLGTFDRLVASPTASPWVLAVKGNSVQAWNVKTWTAGPAGELTPAGDDPRVEPAVVPTPDGKSVVRAVGFPQLSLRVEPIGPGSGPPARTALIKEEFDRASAEGMLDAERVLVRWDKGGSQGLEVWNMKTGGHGKRISLPSFQPAASNGRISPDGRYYALVAQATPAVPDRNPPPGAAAQGPKPHLFVFDLARGTSVSQPINSVDARWATQPTGLAFSSDTKYVAALFEQAGGGILVAWRFPFGRVAPVTTPLAAGKLPPAPHDPRTVNRLDPIAGGGWLVAGNAIVSENGAILGTLGLGAAPAADGAGESIPPIATQYVHGDTVLLTHGQPGQLRATAIKLDPEKLRSSAASK